ncbi:hypothetical protein D3C86_1478870 [compost metagenome]
MFVHVGVVFDVATQRTVEVPEPVGAKEVTTRAPETGPALLLEPRAGQQHFGAAAHVKGEVFAALHVRRGLDHEQAMVIIGTRRAHERPGADKGVRGSKTQAFGIERFGLGRVGDEIHHVGQGAWHRTHVEGDAGLVQRALRCVAGGVGQVVRGVVRLAHGHLKSDCKSHVVDTVQHAVVTGDLTVPRQLVFDGVEVCRAGNAVDGFANRRRRADGNRQGRIVCAANDHGSTVQRFKAPAMAVDVNRRKAVVTQAIGTGLDVIDAKNKGIKANDVHGYHSIEIMIRRLLPNAR